MDEFESLPFFEIDSAYRIEANFKRLQYLDASKEAVAEISFLINRDSVQFLLYKYSGNEKLLFLPYTDLTTGFETHTSGRYLIIPFPNMDKVLIDFNKSMNIDCAYTHEPPCGWPPRDNHFNFPIRAGAKFFQDKNWKKLTKQPKYKKGNAFYPDLLKEAKYPNHVDRSLMKFPISVRAIINIDGSISNPVMKHGFQEDFDKVVLNAFTKMGKGSFEPAELNGNKVRKYLIFVIDPKYFK
ncbi:DUF1684 domain-containing protein [Ekhidna sp.]